MFAVAAICGHLVVVAQSGIRSYIPTSLRRRLMCHGRAFQHVVNPTTQLAIAYYRNVLLRG